MGGAIPLRGEQCLLSTRASQTGKHSIAQSVVTATLSAILENDFDIVASFASASQPTKTGQCDLFLLLSFLRTVRAD